VSIADDEAVSVVRSLLHRSGGGDRLLAYYESRRWHEVHSEDLNEHLRQTVGIDATAKDFRTWHATVLVAVGLAVSSPAAHASRAAARRAVRRAVAEAADYLGNTPAVCKASYVDSRVIDLFEHGETIAEAVERIGRGTPPGTPATHGEVEAAVLAMLRRS